MPRLRSGRGAPADDDQRRAAGRLPLGVEHLPRAAKVPAGRGIERQHAAIPRIERDGDLVVADAAIELERQHEAEHDRTAALELAPQIVVLARDRIRLEAARPREIAQGAEPDAALGGADLADELVESPPLAPRTRDHRERGEAAVVPRPLPDDRDVRGPEPASVERGGLGGPRAALVGQPHAATGQRDRERDQRGAREGGHGPLR